MSQLKISRTGTHLIQSFEGFRAKAVPLSNGKYTIGFGHSLTARDGMVITRQQAEDLLRWDIIPIEEAIRSLIHAPINQNQFDALVSFVFNIGIEKFKQSDVLRHINQGQPVSAAISMNSWRRAHLHGRNIVVDALIRRRAQETALFLEPIGARPAAPSPVVMPQLDYSASLLAPRPDAIKELKPIPHSSAFEINGDTNKLTVDELSSKNSDNDDVIVSNHETEASDDLKNIDNDFSNFEDLTKSESDDDVYNSDASNLSDNITGLELLSDDTAQELKPNLQEIAANQIIPHDEAITQIANDALPTIASDVEEVKAPIIKEAAKDSAHVVKISRPLDEIKSKLSSVSNIDNVVKAENKPEIDKATKVTDGKIGKDVDIANIFMIGAGVIAFIAGLYEMIRAGVFNNGGKDVLLTPSLIFIELVAASGLLAILIGLISKLKSDEK